MGQRKSVCIICGKEKEGLEVQDDYVIKAIRWLKRNVTKNEKGNRLVVCRDCYPKYREMRKNYEKRLRQNIALGVIFLVLLLIFSQNKLYAFLVGGGILLLLYLLTLLNYVPQLKVTAEKELKS